MGTVSAGRVNGSAAGCFLAGGVVCAKSAAPQTKASDARRREDGSFFIWVGASGKSDA